MPGEDDITSAPADGFAIPHWKLVECGSALPICGGIDVDWNPAAPIVDVCNPLPTCTVGSLPTDGHLQCFWVDSGIQACMDWFLALL